MAEKLGDSNYTMNDLKKQLFQCQPHIRHKESERIYWTMGVLVARQGAPPDSLDGSLESLSRMAKRGSSMPSLCNVLYTTRRSCR